MTLLVAAGIFAALALLGLAALIWPQRNQSPLAPQAHNGPRNRKVPRTASTAGGQAETPGGSDMTHPTHHRSALTAIRAGYGWTGRRFVNLWDFIAHDHIWATIAAISLLMAVLIGVSATSSDSGADDTDPITTAVLEAEPDADTSDIAVDIEFIKDQEPDASDEQIAAWIIEVIQWNNCLDENPAGTGCVEISPDNPRNW